jgi:hypothetical protein
MSSKEKRKSTLESSQAMAAQQHQIGDRKIVV